MASGFQAQLEELFAPLGGVTFRRMFGGIGIFREGIMFALVSGDTLYLKADDVTSPAYAAEGSAPWTYPGMRGKATAMPYWRLPDRLLDEPEEFVAWARAAFAVAERGKQPKPKSKPGTKKPALRKAKPARVKRQRS
ncbi:MAG TPA: TfoX/Sxy family protein [Bauldia sp.]|nr:TfoX/Sxy family protein [Bauldia sp.]